MGKNHVTPSGFDTEFAKIGYNHYIPSGLRGQHASHIKPPNKSGSNETSNGLLLRADVDILFRRGYLTVSPGYHVEVSRRIKEDYENGRDYYARQGQPLVTLPADSRDRPENGLLRWHNENVYLG